MYIRKGIWLELKNDESRLLEVISDTDTEVTGRLVETLQPKITYGEIVTVSKEDILDDGI